MRAVQDSTTATPCLAFLPFHSNIGHLVAPNAAWAATCVPSIPERPIGGAAGMARAWLRDREPWALLSCARWPLGFLLLTGTVWIAYSFLPAGDARPSGRKTLVGAGVASTLWIVATLLFRMYIADFARYSRVYGAVGAVIVLLIWFYITALAVLVGGELVATLESGGAARGTPRCSGTSPSPAGHPSR